MTSVLVKESGSGVRVTPHGINARRQAATVAMVGPIRDVSNRYLLSCKLVETASLALLTFVVSVV